MHAKDWGPGQVIADRYELVKQLGKGGMGAVWRAQHLGLKSPVAVKLIDHAIANSQDALQRFMREAQAAAALRSPHVVQTFDYGVFEGTPFIAMELLEGESLAQRLERVRALSPEDTARIITHIARAIARAHEAGIVHRDLKPDNVFLIRNEEEEIAKVLDFGIAKATTGQLGTASQTRTGAILGTPYYMSPEQAEGNRSIDHRTDLWAMGVIACECVTGRRPFESDALGDLILQICMKPIPKPSTFAKVPQGFDGWFARATSRDLEQRFQSARELAEALRAVVGVERSSRLPSDSDLGASPVGAPPPTRSGVTMESAGAVARTANETPAAKGTNRALIAGATFGALALAGVVVFAISSSRHTPAPGGSAALPTALAPAPEVPPSETTIPSAAPAPVPAPEHGAPVAGSDRALVEPVAAASTAMDQAPTGKPRASTPKSSKPPAARVAPTPAPASKPEAPVPTKRQVDFGI
jgi:serine/threonine-protein kinase